MTHQDSTSRFNVFKSKLRSKQGGFIEIIVAIIIGLVILRLLNIDLGTLLQQQWVVDFAIFVRDMIKLVIEDIVKIIHFVQGVSGTATSTTP